MRSGMLQGIVVMCKWKVKDAQWYAARNYYHLGILILAGNA